MSRLPRHLLYLALASIWLLLSAGLPAALAVNQISNPELHKSCSSRIDGPKIVGAEDLFGLGVRGALYIQWLSCLAACVSNHEQALAQVGFNLLSNYVLVLWFWIMSFRGDCVMTVDIVLITQMLHGGIYVSLSSTFWDFARGVHRRSTVFAAILFTVVGPALIFPWIIFAAFGDGKYYRPSPGSNGSVFVFRPDGGPGPWGPAAWFVVILQLWIFIQPPIFFTRQLLHTRWEKRLQVPKPLEHGSKIFWLWALFVTAILSFSIINIEYSIVKNNVENVSRLDLPGQLIPFVTSLGAAACTFWDPVAAALQRTLFQQPEHEPADIELGTQIPDRLYEPRVSAVI